LKAEDFYNGTEKEDCAVHSSSLTLQQICEDHSQGGTRSSIVPDTDCSKGAKTRV